jgi:glycerol uptake facilitator-like aquaporin
MSLASIIMFTGPTCGAHFNPAVTLACFVVTCRERTRENIWAALGYVIAQFAGAALGVIAVFLCQNRDAVK